MKRKSDDLLAEYTKATKDLPPEMRHHFGDFFRGAISNHVSREDWMGCIRTAEGCVKELMKRVEKEPPNAPI